uniref:Uncharacterized protein n=1 Tax=Anopheles atroparvus TaxID=41427 RepID=A0A182JED5_ANOAO
MQMRITRAIAENERDSEVAEIKQKTNSNVVVVIVVVVVVFRLECVTFAYRFSVNGVYSTGTTTCVPPYPPRFVVKFRHRATETIDGQFEADHHGFHRPVFPGCDRSVR